LNKKFAANKKASWGEEIHIYKCNYKYFKSDLLDVVSLFFLLLVILVLLLVFDVVDIQKILAVVENSFDNFVCC